MSVDTISQAHKNINNQSQFSTNSFYIDQIPSQPSQYIFDQLYKSKKNKYKFGKDRNYSYFANILKIQNKFQGSSNLYQKIFAKPKKSNKGKQENQIQQRVLYHGFSKQKLLNKSLEVNGKSLPGYRIQRLNSQTFKIYRPVVRKSFDFQLQNSLIKPSHRRGHSLILQRQKQSEKQNTINKQSSQKEIKGVMGVSFQFSIQRPKSHNSNYSRSKTLNKKINNNNYPLLDPSSAAASLSSRNCKRHIRRLSAPQPKIRIIPNFTMYTNNTNRQQNPSPIHSRKYINKQFTIQ